MLLFVCLAKKDSNELHEKKNVFNRTFKHFSAGIILGFGAESSIEILSVYPSALWKFFR